MWSGVGRNPKMLYPCMKCGDGGSALHIVHLVLYSTVSSSWWTSTSHSQLWQAGSTYTAESHPQVCQVRANLQWNSAVGCLHQNAARTIAPRCRGVVAEWCNQFATIIDSYIFSTFYFLSNSIVWLLHQLKLSLRYTFTTTMIVVFHEHYWSSRYTASSIGHVQ